MISQQEPGLGALTRIPFDRAVEIAPERRNGLTSSEWRARFAALHDERVRTEERLEETNQSIHFQSSGLSGTAVSYRVDRHTDGWVRAGDAPRVDPKLVELMREDRETIARVEHDSRQLHIDADLHDVPDAWRRVASESAASDVGRGEPD